jgi:predicted transcriptional regulator
MSTKQIVQHLLERLPDDVSLHEVAREIEFIAGVREGFESYEREGGVTTEEAKARISSWVKSATS